MCSISTGKTFSKVFNLAEIKYSDALELAQELDGTNPLRLALYFNYAILHSLKKDYDEAMMIAQEAFDTSLNEFDQLDEEDKGVTIEAMELIDAQIIKWGELSKEKQLLDEHKAFSIRKAEFNI